MKKLILNAIALSVIMVSCSKEEAPSRVNNMDSFVPMEMDGPPRPRFVDNGTVPGVDGTDFGCLEPNGNCLPEVVVTSSANPGIISGVIDVINTGSLKNIQISFSNNETELGKVIPEGLVSGVIGGQYEVVNRGEFGKNSNAYLQFTENGQLIQVTPLQE